MFKLNVPFLCKGEGAAPSQGGCIMQVIDWIHREMWTDAPPCVHPVLRGLAIETNDFLPDDDRQKLLDLVPRLMGTNDLSEEQHQKLQDFIHRTFYPETRLYFYTRDENDWFDLGTNLAFDHDDKFQTLFTLLDEFDRLLGRTSVEPVDFTRVCKVMATA